MISGLHLGVELRRFRRSKLGRVAIGAIVLIPLLYSALYLWAFWNPFGNVDKLPVAFVNDDKGTVVDGAPLNAGDKVVDGLQKQDRVKFHYVSDEEALNGVKDGKYYFMVRLTPDFSKAVASSGGTQAEKAVIQANYNSTNGYLSTLIGQNTLRELVPAISSTLGDQVIDKVLVGLQDAGSGLAQAAGGADQLKAGADTLHDGLSTAQNGVNQLSSGMDTALDGTTKLHNGAQEVDSKMGELVDGANQLADGTTELKQGVDSASSKLTELTSGVSQLQGGVDQLGSGAAQINDGVQRLAATANQAEQFQSAQSANVRNIANQLRGIPDPAVQNTVKQLDDVANQIDAQGLGKNSQALSQVHALSDGTSQLSYQLNDNSAPFRSGFNQLASGTGQIPGQIGKLVDGVDRLDQGSHQLASGAQQLKSQGTSQVALNLGTLRDGMVKLDNGTNELKQKMPQAVDGSKKLADGAATMANRLGDGSRQVPKWTTAERENSAQVMANPTSLEAQDDAGNQVFGSGLAPFFCSLGMFIGGLAIFMLLRPMQNRAIASGITPLRAAIDGLLPASLIAVAQATVIILVTHFFVGLHAVHPWALWLFCMLSSVMFASINQMLMVALGPGPGKVGAMALLMLQILSSGGLYPVETQPRFFQILHPVNPWTYTINGFRQLLYGNIDSRLYVAIVVVIAILALCVTVTALCARRDRLWTIKRLHPPINI